MRAIVRKRAHLVRQHTANVLSVQHILGRHTGPRFSAQRMHALSLEARERLLPAADHVLAVTTTLALLPCLGPQINTLEHAVTQRLKHPPASTQLLSVEGIGERWAQTSVLATGEMGRFPPGGN